MIQKVYRWFRRLFGFKNKLDGKWTVDSVVDLEAMHGIDAENELAKILSEEIINEIEQNGTKTWKEHIKDGT